MIIQPREKVVGPRLPALRPRPRHRLPGRERRSTCWSQYRKTWLNRLGGEWLTEAQIGRRTRTCSPSSTSRSTSAAAGSSRPTPASATATRGVFVGDDHVAEYDVKEARVGRRRGRGARHLGRAARSVRCGAASMPGWTPARRCCLRLKETSAGVRARAVRRPARPRRGSRATATAPSARPTSPTRALGSDRNYQRLEGELHAAMSWGAHTFNFERRGRHRSHSDMPAYESFTLGGPLRLSGYRINEFAGRDMAFGRADVLQPRAAPARSLGSGVYVGGSLEAGDRARPLRRPLVGRKDQAIVVGLGVPRRGHVRRPGLLRARRRRARPVELYLLLGVP